MICKVEIFFTNYMVFSSTQRGISKEQVCVLVARDRQKIIYSKVVGQGRIVKTRLEEAIGSWRHL
jgi:hypothetical protein